MKRKLKMRDNVIRQRKSDATKKRGKKGKPKDLKKKTLLKLQNVKIEVSKNWI